MASMKRGAMVASILMLVAVIASACERPFSSAPSVTNTPLPGFASTLGPNSMTEVMGFATQTSLALSGTPDVSIITATPGVDASGATFTPTPLIALPTDAITTPTATLAVAGTSQGQVLNTSVPVGSRPSEYILQDGEFPYCIARRFDVDPEQLLSTNGLVDGQTLYAGRKLTIPQSGSFPGARALRNHPATYTATSGQTLYAVACVFGDVRPEDIATANGIAVDTRLTAGQQLSIP